MAAKQATLTGKQRHFAQCVAGGMTQSDAYREAYNVGADTLQKSVHEKASHLMAEDKIRARVDALVALRDKAFIRSSADMKAKVLTKLEEFMDHADPTDNVRLRAAELLGKSVGLFKEVIEDSRNQLRTSDEIESEVLAKLAILLGEGDDTKH